MAIATQDLIKNHHVERCRVVLIYWVKTFAFEEREES